MVTFDSLPELQVFLLDLAVEPRISSPFVPGATLHTDRARRRYARAAGWAAAAAARRFVQRRRAAPEIERTFLPLAHLASPQLAELVVAGEELR